MLRFLQRNLKNFLSARPLSFHLIISKGLKNLSRSKLFDKIWNKFCAFSLNFHIKQSTAMKFFVILIFLVLSSNAKVLEKRVGRVAGGRPAMLGEIPYFALIHMIDEFGEVSQCGGSLIRFKEFKLLISFIYFFLSLYRRYNWILTVIFLSFTHQT